FSRSGLWTLSKVSIVALLDSIQPLIMFIRVSNQAKQKGHNL
ncbi:unnamed protein product, partial [Allacma fusca]